MRLYPIGTAIATVFIVCVGVFFLYFGFSNLAEKASQAEISIIVGVVAMAVAVLGFRLSRK
jgi:divalent metal cation (Fe/Co/Zn/Cd) transporter